MRKGQDEIIGLRIVYDNKVLVRAGKSWQWLQNPSERGEGRLPWYDSRGLGCIVRKEHHFFIN